MDEQLARSQDAIVQALGRQSAFWGLGKASGEMYAVLYLSPAPLSLEELASRLGVTKGNVSVAIRQLEHLNMVRRSQQKGDRRIFFEAETDFWKIGRSVLSLRHRPEFAESFSLVEEGARLADGAKPSPDKELVTQRLQSLQEFYRLLDDAVEAVLSMSPDHLKKVLEMARLLGQKGHP